MDRLTLFQETQYLGPVVAAGMSSKETWCLDPLVIAGTSQERHKWPLR